MKKIIFIIFTFSMVQVLDAQHFVLSQFPLSPINVSPSLSGTSGTDQIVLNHRNQWYSLFNKISLKTYSLSYDRPFQLKNGDRIGVGARYFYDHAGTHNLTKQFGGLSFSYQKEISDNENQKHFIDLGIEGGLGQTSIMFGEILAVEPEEFENLETKNSFEDFSLGVNYRIQFEDNRKMVFGGAIHQLGSTFPKRISLYSIVDFKIGKNFQLSPALYYERISGADILVASLTPTLYFGKNQLAIYLGTRSGLTDPDWILIALPEQAFFISPTFFFKNQFGIAVTFERDIDELHPGGLDSFECSIIYRFQKKKTTNIEK